MSEKLLRVAEVQARVGLSRPTIYRWMAAGRFPKPIALGPALVAWPESVVEAWIQAQIHAESDAPASSAA